MCKNKQKLVTDFLTRARLKPYQLADLIGLHRSILYRWLNNESDIKLSTWEKIEKIVSR